ncbi:hypothetical protein AAW01_11670 [Aurantiacibacter gangjinensis]|uniref:Cadherin domain-containing protein n=1 Tax=Aurantiacibacter gangjinensis TaxID=502682 RepID=A0A0G9MRW7_9SPHN|nr:hypothetical protein AAW01_11670 [Aurantiacibacter gangjinensis]
MAACTIVTGCGGEDPPDPPPPELNRAPQITSPANLDLEEGNAFGLEISATDADGDALTFSIVGGADADAFEFFRNTLLTRGNLDFELPLDADGNNIFEVVIEVSDGEATAQRALRITVVNSREGFELRRIRSGLGTVAAASTVDRNRIWVVGTDGSFWEEAIDVRDTSAELGRIPGFGGAIDSQILSVGSITDLSGQLNALVLSRHGAEVRLTEYLRAQIASGMPGTVRWSVTFADASSVSASLFAEGGQMMLALGDNGTPATAQDIATPFGGLFRISGSANTGLTFNRVGNGLRDPRLGYMTDDGIRIIDRGLLQDEINERPSGNNFEWPLRDGERDGPVTSVPSTPGNFASPTFVWPADESGTFVDFVENARYCTLDGLSMVVGTSDGRFFSGSTLIGRFEERTQDFIPDAGTIDEVIAVELYDDIYWELTRVAVVDRDGEIFILDQTIPCDKF